MRTRQKTEEWRRAEKVLMRTVEKSRDE